MQDRPAFGELLAAIEHFLDAEIVPNVPGSRGFHARVAANAIRIIRRELELEDEVLAAEWAGLDAILGPEDRPVARDAARAALRAREARLCERIRDGEADSGVFAARVAGHVRRTVRDKLRASDPDLLRRSGGREESGE
ncbi:MAG: DUF6285 domain-containing protein [Dehalococcoidia bacterium]|nr:DUF6285 domain-containing protein [Dehalococcoidia bacterium]